MKTENWSTTYQLPEIETVTKKSFNLFLGSKLGQNSQPIINNSIVQITLELVVNFTVASDYENY